MLKGTRFNRVVGGALGVLLMVASAGCGDKIVGIHGEEPGADVGTVALGGPPASTEGAAPPAAIAGGPLVLGDITIQGSSYATSDGVAPAEWLSLQGNPKVQHLIAKASQSLGVPVVPKPNHGLVTTMKISYTKNGVTSTMPVRFHVIPLAGTASNGSTATLLIGRYTETNLLVPRLLVRPDPNNWFASEYAYRLDGRVTLMTSKFGDCLFRSSLRVLEVKNSAAHNALRARLASTAVRGTSLGDGIKGVYDARITGAAVSEMLDATAIVTAGNVEEEYPGAYISNAIDQAYKVWPTDSQTVKLIKALAKDILMSYFGQYQYLWTWIKNFFGFE